MVAVEESQIQSERFLPRSVSFVTVWREDACSLALSVGLLASRDGTLALRCARLVGLLRDGGWGDVFY